MVRYIIEYKQSKTMNLINEVDCFDNRIANGLSVQAGYKFDIDDEANEIGITSEITDLLIKELRYRIQSMGKDAFVVDTTANTTREAKNLKDFLEYIDNYEDAEKCILKQFSKWDYQNSIIPSDKRYRSKERCLHVFVKEVTYPINEYTSSTNIIYMKMQLSDVGKPIIIVSLHP